MGRLSCIAMRYCAVLGFAGTLVAGSSEVSEIRNSENAKLFSCVLKSRLPEYLSRSFVIF